MRCVLLVALLSLGVCLAVPTPETSIIEPTPMDNNEQSQMAPETSDQPADVTSMPAAMGKPMTSDEKESQKEEFSGRADYEQDTVIDAVKRIYSECVQQGSFACIKPKVLAFLSKSLKKDTIFLTRDLAIERTGQEFPVDNSYANEVTHPALERVERFLGSHSLKVRLPEELRSAEFANYVPSFLLDGLPSELRVPLSDGAVQSQERGFMKKVMIPFLLGLKFKATALIPLAMALIALKTWKALTLGLLSLVLTGAMLIFRLSKPKVVSYEVVHYPHPAPVIEAHPAPSPYDHHGYGRNLDLPYRAYAKPQ